MKKTIRILGVLLGVQAILTVSVGMTAHAVRGVSKGDPFLRFDPKGVDRVILSSPQSENLLIEKRDNGWVLPGLGAFPAFNVKVDALLTKISGWKRNLPISTSTGALKRFKVSSSEYEHTVSFTSGEKVLGTVWLGSSSNLRQVHGRLDGENTVYDLDLSVQEIGTDPNQWTDKTFLHLKPEEINQIILGDLKVVRKEGKWQAEGLATGETLQIAEVDTLANQVSFLSFDVVLGQEGYTPPTPPALTFSVGTSGGISREYIFSKMESDPKKPENPADKVYVLKTSTSPYYFKVAGFMVKDLVELNRAKLVKGPQPVATPAPQAVVPTPSAQPPVAPTAPTSEVAPEVTPVPADQK
ncbi:hypothetical protein CCP3SC1AL1_60016 [Gammaproteobacteria bacterium]